jgi:hypothetical protein
MLLKTLSIILGSIILLTATMLLVLEPPGTRNLQSDVAVSGAEDNSAPENRATKSADLAQFTHRIPQVSSKEEFEAIAGDIAENVPAENRRALMELLYSHWLKLDVESALDYARKSRQAENGGMLQEYALVTGGAVSFPSVFNWVMAQKIEEAEKKALINMLYFGVGRESQVLALTFIDLLVDEVQKDQIMRALIEQWAAKDLPSTLSWMSSRELSESMEELKQTLILRSTGQESAAPDTAIRNMAAGQEKNKLAREYADQLAKTDISAAANWARSLDDPEAYKVALSAVFEAWVLQEPDKRKILQELLAESDSQVRDHLINEVALDIASSNPQDLAAMINQVPETAQSQVAEKIVRFWQVRSSEDTLKWITGLDAGPVKDRAAGVMAELLLNANNNEQAIALIKQMQEQTTRYESSKSLINRIKQRDPAEARKILDQLEFLSKEEKESIFAGL